MKNSLLTIVAASMAFASMLANAGNSAQLAITGKIVPAACTLHFSGDGRIDYGNIASGSLNADKETELPVKHVNFTVECPAATQFALTVNDERAGTAIQFAQGDANINFGLGAVDDVNVGAYRLHIKDVTSENGVSNALYSEDGGKTWNGNHNFLYNNTASMMTAFGSGTSVQSYRHIAVNLDISAYIEKASSLRLDKEVPLDGLATFEIVYL